jgi:hypothetical protein
VKISRTLTILAASGGLAMLGLMSAGAASAGTYTSGSWSLYAPSTVSAATAQVLQPINSDGSSVFNHKSSTVPVQYKVTQTESFAFESIGTGDSGNTPVAWDQPNENAYSVLSYTMPAGVTVADLTGLVADFSWTSGFNHGGGFRWQVETPSGNIMVDYGDAATTMQTGIDGSGVNMVNSPTAQENRDESNQVGGTMYTPWSYVASTFGGLTVTGVDLVVDAGWGGDQVLNLTDASVTYTGGSSTFTMPAGITTASNTAPAYIYLAKVSGQTPAAQIDETLLYSTQGDSGGQFRQVDGKYIYNLPVKQLTDLSATYKVGISFNSDGSDPVGVVGFGLK